MFRILVPGGRKSRRNWSAGTVAVSVAAHAALFALVGYAAVGTAKPPKVDEPPILWQDFDPLPHPPLPAPPQPVEPAEPTQPDAPAPVVGATRVLVPPRDVPDDLSPPRVEPVASPAEYGGIGPAGDVIGTPVPGDDRPPTGNTDRDGGVREGDVVDAAVLAEAPAVQNRREARRALERLYPAALRDSGVSGRALLQFVVGTDGRVEPESIRVVSATHEGFGEASRRAVERFRFRPARVNGTPVRVLISLPIDWVAPAS